MSQSLKRKNRTFFVSFILSEEIYLTFVFYLNVQCVEYTFRKYILLLIKRNYFVKCFACF